MARGMYKGRSTKARVEGAIGSCGRQIVQGTRSSLERRQEGYTAANPQGSTHKPGSQKK